MRASEPFAERGLETGSRKHAELPPSTICMAPPRRTEKPRRLVSAPFAPSFLMPRLGASVTFYRQYAIEGINAAFTLKRDV